MDPHGLSGRHTEVTETLASMPVLPDFAAMLVTLS